ncbi:hypothetical protein Nepgr_002806 [Nepenthes gracilis]|uniref:Uncharacterized protein n=1 Tax=Nepenthes gracilis TaxID=150966 RepID=A0AAD3PAC0_NEPGR|nr:hypothetical protein Nepgr_002806 [Nepenthes gracilis]
MIGFSVSPPLSPPPVSPCGLSEIDNATLRSPISLAHKNLVDLSQIDGASEDVLASSIQPNEALGSVGKNCSQVESESILVDPLSGKLGTSVALAPALTSVPAACPRPSSQNKQTDLDALPGSTKAYASEIDSISVDKGSVFSIDPLASHKKSCWEEQSHLSS